MVISGAGTARQTVTAASWLTPKRNQVSEYSVVHRRRLESGQKSIISFQVVREERSRKEGEFAFSETFVTISMKAR